MVAWALIPDKLDEEEHKPARFGAFLTTLIAFFLVEMGDKTQVATIVLRARFHNTLGLANVEFEFPKDVRFPTLPVRT